MGSLGQLVTFIDGSPPRGNYLPEACRGCVVVHRSHPLILGTGPADDYEAPFQWDPHSKVFTIVNANRYPCFTYLTFCGVDVHDRHGNRFTPGITRAESGEERPATTFVIVASPHTAVRLGRVEVGPASADFYAIELERLMDPPLPLGPPDTDDDESGTAFGFPLPAATGPYLCTQGVGGHLTHFFPESYHAIDLRCCSRTPVLSIGDGFVKEVTESHRCGGIHAANLAAWNAVSVHLTCGLVVEYLHTLPGSARVKKGDAVRLGQVLCETGDIGFAPEPHLHIELHDAGEADGPSLPLAFGKGRTAFVPVAGRWYSAEGEAHQPPGAGGSSPSGAAASTSDEAAPPPPTPYRGGSAPMAGSCRLTLSGRRRAARFARMALKQKLSRCGSAAKQLQLATCSAAPPLRGEGSGDRVRCVDEPF